MSSKEHFMYIREIGNLFLYDVLLSYIYPRIFVCEDEYDCKYLFYEMESENQRDSWLVSKIRKKDYYDLVDRKTSIQAIYKKAAERDLFSITKTYGEIDNTILSLEYKQWMKVLPPNDVYAEKELLDSIDMETLEAARITGATTLDFRLFPGTDRHFVPNSIMTSLLKNVSSLADSIFGKRHTNILRVCTTPGSCVVRFSFAEQVDLLDESNAINEVQIINKLLGSDFIETNLAQVKNKGGFIQSYTNLLNTIKKTRSMVQITSAFPNSTKTNRIDLTSDIIEKRSNEMENIFKERIKARKIDGKLIALDIKAKKFKFSTQEEDSESTIFGTVDDFVLSESYEVPGNYIADIRETEYFDHNDFIPKKQYLLTQLTK